MHLSRLILNPRSKRVRSEIANPYEMHRTTMHAFPGPETGGPGRVLFRLDSDRHGSRLLLLVQSEKEPDWSFLSKPSSVGYLLDTFEADIDKNPDQKMINVSSIAVRSRSLMFRLRANPTVKRNGKRRAIVKEDDQITWLNRKASSGGFEITGLRITPENTIWGRRPGSDKLLFNSVLFNGVLRIKEPEKFSSALANGIGSAKGFGVGMLSLSKPG